MLQEIMSEKELAELFRRKSFSPRFPEASDRAAWAEGNHPYRRKRFPLYLRNAELWAKRPYAEIYPPLKGEDYFAFVRNGNRSVFESYYFGRRTRLTLFCMAEAVEYRKRYLPLVIEGVWQLMNELVWYLPAHGHYREGDPMPRFDQPRTDLFCAETGSTLACVVQLLGREIGEESKELLTWVKELCVERVIAPVEDDTVPQWWLGGINNWSPWCASNVAMTAFTFLRDQPERLARMIWKLIGVCERFYDRYAPDGGCDEGPGYFMVAGLRLMMFLDLLNACTDNAYARIYSEPKFRNIGDYIAKVHLTGPWFASMADSIAKFDRIDAGLLNRFAELSGSSRLKAFVLNAAYGFDSSEKAEVSDGTGGSGEFPHLILQNELSQLFWYPRDLTRTQQPSERLTVLPDLQFFRFRQNPGDDRDGTVLCMKGGHNGENHNHNDVGQFEVFRNGSPVAIDCGSTDYTRFTFSDRRYENRFLNSSGHNVPAFNGVLQEAGEEYGARILSDTDEVMIDISGAYPASAGITSCVRRAALSPDGTALIEDSATGSGEISVLIPLYCCEKPVPVGEGIRIGGMVLHPTGLEAGEIEEIPLSDRRMRISWGGTLWCIPLKGSFRDRGCWELEFVPAE